MLTDENFAQLLRIADFLQADKLIEHLREALHRSWGSLMKMEYFNTKAISYRMMEQLLVGFTDSEEAKLNVLSM